MPNKRNNHINPEGGRRKPTFEYAEDDGTTMKQALILPTKTKNKCRRNEEWIESQRCEKEMKLGRSLRLNKPHKALFWSKIRRGIMIRNPTVRVKKEIAMSFHQRSRSCRLTRSQKRLKEVKRRIEKTVEKHAYSLLVISHVIRWVDGCTQIHPWD